PPRRPAQQRARPHRDAAKSRPERDRVGPQRRDELGQELTRPDLRHGRRQNRESINCPPCFGCTNPPINLTSVTSRPLHAVLLPPAHGGGRLLEALAAALDGSGPAILPLDPSLPRARLAELITAFAPVAIETTEGVRRTARASRGGHARSR